MGCGSAWVLAGWVAAIGLSAWASAWMVREANGALRFAQDRLNASFDEWVIRLDQGRKNAAWWREEILRGRAMDDKNVTALLDDFERAVK